MKNLLDYAKRLLEAFEEFLQSAQNISEMPIREAFILISLGKMPHDLAATTCLFESKLFPQSAYPLRSLIESFIRMKWVLLDKKNHRIAEAAQQELVSAQKAVLVWKQYFGTKKRDKDWAIARDRQEFKR